MKKIQEVSYRTLLNRLEEGGTTALGPALLIAATMAGNHPGSKVIICTDGKANVGVGRLDEEESMEKEAAFYENIGKDAIEKGYVSFEIQRNKIKKNSIQHAYRYLILQYNHAILSSEIL